MVWTDWTDLSYTSTMAGKATKRRSGKKRARRATMKVSRAASGHTMIHTYTVTMPADVSPREVRTALRQSFGTSVRVEPIVSTQVEVGSYTDNDLDALRQKAIDLEFATRRRLLRSARPVDYIRELLGVRSRQTVHNWILHGKVLALDDGNRKVLPVWQFDSTTRDRLVPGFKRVLDVLDRSPFSAAVWFTNRNPRLGNKSPISVLRTGDTETVLKIASRANQTP